MSRLQDVVNGEAQEHSRHGGKEAPLAETRENASQGRNPRQVKFLGHAITLTGNWLPVGNRRLPGHQARRPLQQTK